MLTKEAIFVADLFDFLFKKYNINDSARNSIYVMSDEYNENTDENWRTLPPAKSEFTEEVGKAVLGLSYAFRHQFREDFNKCFSDLQRTHDDVHNNIIAFARSKLECDDFFRMYLTVMAYAGELSVFCYTKELCTQSHAAAISLNYVMRNNAFKERFYAKGGWEALNLCARSFSGGYDVMRRLIETENPKGDKVPFAQSVQVLGMDKKTLSKCGTESVDKESLKDRRSEVNEAALNEVIRSIMKKYHSSRKGNRKSGNKSQSFKIPENGQNSQLRATAAVPDSFDDLRAMNGDNKTAEVSSSISNTTAVASAPLAPCETASADKSTKVMQNSNNANNNVLKMNAGKPEKLQFTEGNITVVSNPNFDKTEIGSVAQNTEVEKNAYNSGAKFSSKAVELIDAEILAKESEFKKMLQDVEVKVASVNVDGQKRVESDVKVPEAADNVQVNNSPNDIQSSVSNDNEQICDNSAYKSDAKGSKTKNSKRKNKSKRKM